MLFLINNLITASRVHDRDKLEAAGFPPDAALKPEQLAVYGLTRENGGGAVAKLLNDGRRGLIGDNALDEAGLKFSDDFYNLQELIADQPS